MITIERLRRRNNDKPTEPPGSGGNRDELSAEDQASLKRVVNRRKPATTAWTDEHFRRQRDDDLAPLLVTWRQALVAVGVALLFTLALSTNRLVDIATQMPLGEQRDFALDVATALDDVASAVWLDRPATWIAEQRGGLDAGRNSDQIDASIIDTSLIPEPTSGPPSTDGLDVATPATPTDPDAAQVPISPEPAETEPPEVEPAPVTPIEVPGLRAVSADEPLRLFVGGDSQAEFLNYALIERSDAFGLPTDIAATWQISTGLARPDVFNWPAQLADQIATSDPEAVILFLGANDSQDMAAEDGVASEGTPEWEAEYRRRLEITMDIVAAPHRRLFWVAQPPMQDGGLDSDMEYVNEIAASVAAERDWVIWVDAYGQFGGEDGFSTFLPDLNGEDVKVRAGDGVHLSQEGANWLGDAILATMTEVWTAEG